MNDTTKITETYFRDNPFSAESLHALELEVSRGAPDAEILADFLRAHNEAIELESDITQKRMKSASNLELAAQLNERAGKIEGTISKGCYAFSFVLAAAGSASLVTESEMGLRIIILSLGVLQSISQVAAHFAKNNKEEAKELRQQVNEIVRSKKRVAEIKRAELKRRGVDLETINAKIT